MKKIWATIDRFEDNKAVLILADGQNIVIARQSLPLDLKEGDIVTIDFKICHKQRAHQNKMAKRLLNKI